MSLSDSEKKFLTFVEQYYAVRNMYPRDEVLEKFAIKYNYDYEEILSYNVKLEPYLVARGISKRGTGDSSLSEDQLAAIHLVTNYADRRSFEKKLKSIGVTPTKWRNWLNDKVFMNYLSFITDKMLGINMSSVNEGLLKAAEAGNVRAAQFIYELTGKYKRDSPVANVQLLIVQIIEVIQKHVKDPEILRNIGTDFEMLMLKNKVVGSSHDEIEGEVSYEQSTPAIENSKSNYTTTPVDLFDSENLFS